MSYRTSQLEKLEIELDYQQFKVQLFSDDAKTKVLNITAAEMAAIQKLLCGAE